MVFQGNLFGSLFFYSCWSNSTKRRPQLLFFFIKSSTKLSTLMALDGGIQEHTEIKLIISGNHIDIDDSVSLHCSDTNCTQTKNTNQKWEHQ